VNGRDGTELSLARGVSRMDMDHEKMMKDIMREMLRVAFEKVGGEIMKKNPGFTPADMKDEANRLTTIYLENYDSENNTFDIELIQRICGAHASD
jgi:hypothetical protein